MTELPDKISLPKRTGNLPASLIDLKFVRELFTEVCKLSEEAKPKELLGLEKFNSDEENYESRKKSVDKHWSPLILVKGCKGEQYVIKKVELISEDDLFDQIDSLSIYMSGMYGIGGAAEYYSITIDIDCRQTSPLDLQVQPGLYGLSMSQLSIGGLDQTWVDEKFELIQSRFREKATWRWWLYKRSIYEILLFVLGFPLCLLAVAEADPYTLELLSGVSGGVKIAVQVFIFLVTLQVFRTIFQYSRWAYPYMELKREKKTKVVVHRLVHGAILSSIAYWALHNVLDIISR